MKLKTKTIKLKGFTIIELLVATLVFSIVLLIILSAFIAISRMFYKGINVSRTQDDARTIISDIASDIAFSQAPVNFNAIGGTGRPANSYFCVGLHRYKYQLGYQLGTSATNNYGILRQDVNFANGCTATAAGTNSEELLNDGMQLNNLDISCAGGRCLITVHVIFYGGTPNGLFAPNNSSYASDPWMSPEAQCTGSLTSSQYCAVADYSSVVLQRP